MAIWLWLKGIPGPPANDEWFQVLSYNSGAIHRPSGGSTGRSAGTLPPKVISLTVPLDSRSTQFFQAMINGQIMELASVFFEPQTQFVLSRALFSSVSSGSGQDAPLNCSLSFDSMVIEYGTD